MGVVEEPGAAEPVVAEPVVEEPVAAEPVVAEPVVEEPVVVKVDAEVEAPVEAPVETPVAEEPVAEEPVEKVEEVKPCEQKEAYTNHVECLKNAKWAPAQLLNCGKKLFNCLSGKLSAKWW